MRQGILFDMDGTLWDSSHNVAVAWNRAIAGSGLRIPELTAEDIQGVMGKTMDVIADLLFPQLEKTRRTELMDICCRMENDYLREHGGVLYEGVEETFQALQGTYHLCIVSNCQKGYIEAFLEHYQFGKYIEDWECYGNNLLQKGENIRMVARRNQLDKTIYVGDIQGDYDASRQAGADFIHAAYGFGTIDEDVKRIESLKELVRIL